MKSKKEWVYTGRKNNGKPKFRVYTNQTAEHVKEYLDKKGIAYVHHKRPKMFFIFKEKEPSSRYAPRYAYYYTTGMWGNDKRTKHYYSNGIEHFIETYYTTLEESIKYWEDKNNEEE